MRERAALYDWKCVQRKPSYSVYILIYMVKFAKEIPSIQRLHHHNHEDGVIQSSNETISKERKRPPTAQVKGHCCVRKRCCLICFFWIRYKTKKAKENVVLRTEDYRLEYIYLACIWSRRQMMLVVDQKRCYMHTCVFKQTMMSSFFYRKRNLTRLFEFLKQ